MRTHAAFVETTILRKCACNMCHVNFTCFPCFESYFWCYLHLPKPQEGHGHVEENELLKLIKFFLVFLRLKKMLK